jgi:hypothetical protein
MGVPHVLEDLRAGVHRADVPGKVCQQVELLGGQDDFVVGDAYSTRSSIELHRADLLWTGVVALVSCRRPVGCSTGHGANPGDEFAQAERFGDVVVGAQLQTQDTIELLAARRQHDDRCLGLLAQLAAHVSAVHVGQAEIEQHQFVAAFRQGPGARRDVDDGVAGGVEPLDQGFGDGSVVFDQQQFHPVIVTSVAVLDELLGQILDVRGLSLGRRARTVSPSKDPPIALFGGKALTMKTTVATMLSLAGVLVAGSAAALVNTQVLSGSSDPSSFVVEAAPALPSVANTVAAAVVGTTVVAPASASASPPVTAATVAASAAPTQALYQVGESGTVILDTAGDVLKIVNVAPADGWTVTKSELKDPLNVEVRLRSAVGEVEFHANLLFGVVTPSVALAVARAAAVAAAAATTAVMAVAAMINDPLMPATSAERLAALRSAAPKRRQPAYNSKIMTAGLTTTAMLGMIAAMGWTSATSAQSVPQLVPATDALPPIDTTGVGEPMTAPVTVLPVTAVAPVPATVAPSTVAPVTVAPLIAPPIDTSPIDTTPPTDPVVTDVVVPQAVPAPKPVTKKKKKRVTAPAPVSQPSG